MVAQGLTHEQVAEQLGVSLASVDQHFAAGQKTSFYLSPVLAQRWRVVRAYTGYRSSDVFELGLVRVEAELSSAFAWPPGKNCWHERRFPNGRCVACYQAALGTWLRSVDDDAERERGERLDDVI